MVKKLPIEARSRTAAFLVFSALAALSAQRSLAVGWGRVGQESGRAATPSRSEMAIDDPDPSPENLTSSKDGTVFFGSTSKGIVYRALPNETKASAWIKGNPTGLTNVTGLLADDRTGTLWVCANPPFGRSARAGSSMVLEAFDLKTGAPKRTYPVAGGGVLNDVAIAKDGAVFVSESFGGRIVRLKPGAKEAEVWANDPQLRGVDGLTFLADGALYVNNFFNGKLSRIAAKGDGTAGSIVDIQTSSTFSRPDGLRTSDRNTLLQAEGQGRLTETTIQGDRGEVRVVKEGLARAAGVTQIGASAMVLVEGKRAIAVAMATAIAPGVKSP